MGMSVEFEMAFAARVGDVLTEALAQFEVSDPGHGAPELRCAVCLTHVCDVEQGDTLAVLMATALQHKSTCTPPRPAHQHEAWQLDEGGTYCRACGDTVVTSPVVPPPV